eukprot:CAMPEP_0113858908 /NCGR_PEP_ID=MMETSP0372-20130328/11715_1 /TAXON_ID=340204 /ORGANISM="Lankesteria abbotti" /LENGTH=109 /DNA_ID=CAMNT_0000836397 /DNA_START=526 /DNA_END=855 /DNA_ORIENTATION=- /assembly_acc=CAM_ASM_000359
MYNKIGSPIRHVYATPTNCEWDDHMSFLSTCLENTAVRMSDVSKSPCNTAGTDNILKYCQTEGRDETLGVRRGLGVISGGKLNFAIRAEAKHVHATCSGTDVKALARAT